MTDPIKTAAVAFWMGVVVAGSGLALLFVNVPPASAVMAIGASCAVLALLRGEDILRETKNRF